MKEYIVRVRKIYTQIVDVQVPHAIDAKHAETMGILNSSHETYHIDAKPILMSDIEVLSVEEYDADYGRADTTPGQRKQEPQTTPCKMSTQAVMNSGCYWNRVNHGDNES